MQLLLETNIAWFGIDEVELERRRKWTTTAHNQVSCFRLMGVHMQRQKLLNDRSCQEERENLNAMRDINNNFISSESERRLLFIK